MKILMISDVYFPRINGVSTSIETFRNDLHEHGCHTLLVAPDYGAVEREQDGIIRIPSRRLPLDPEDRMMRMRDIIELTAKVREQGVDLVHIQTPFVAHYAGTRLAEALQVPCVETYHTFFEEYLFHYVPIVPKRWMRGLSRRFSREQCNAVDAIIVPSNAMRQVLGDYGVKRPIHILPTGIPLQRFAEGDGEAFRRKHNLTADRPVLLYVGRVAFEKNIEFLLRSVTKIRHKFTDVLLLITGEGPALKSLRQQVDALGLAENVRFLGYLDRRQELLDCYRAADAFVFASRTETQGLVLLEAMALGVPVVSTAAMGTRDILAPQRGALVAEDNEEDFAAKVILLLGDASLRQRLRSEAPNYAQEWCAKRMARRLARLYGEII